MGSTGLSGRIARAFIKSKLTPLIVISALLLGLFAVIATPREEEPQIVVPMVDVFVAYPGASAKEVEERVTTPVEKLLWEIKGVEYVYSIASPGMNLTIVRFYVGQNMEESIVKLYDKLMANSDMVPPGASPPLVKPKSIDDVPALSLTLWSDRYSGYDLRAVAAELADELKKGADVSGVSVIGGQRRRVRIDIDPYRLKARGVSPFQITGALAKANFALRAGEAPLGNSEYIIEAGGFLKDVEDVRSVVAGVYNGKPVYLRDVADVSDGPEEPRDYVFMGLGPAAQDKGIDAGSFGRGEFEAVTIALSKKKGANASVVADEAIDKAESLKGALIPQGVNLTVTRNYGETAKEKSDELLEHMLIATIAVIILIALALGWRESLVVAVAVPVTLALTLLVNHLYGYTLNRVTLFALIFSIGILVDDAIVVVENIHRHFRMKGVSVPVAVAAVDEVGNPTILATFTVIAALLPMAFVSGLMGPYMRPIPVGASAAMLFSLLVAFIVSPWIGYKVLRHVDHGAGEGGGKLNAAYERLLRPLIASRNRRMLALWAVVLLLGLAVVLVPLKLVAMKILPFDNKSELELIIDMPEGATLERTAALTRKLGEYIRTVPEVTDYQSYIGTSSPFNFNGLVRHYYLRSGSNVADIQINFAPKSRRATQSHDIAKRLRPEMKRIADGYGARIKLAEVPPGPPVLSTLVAEVYGPDQKGRIAVARQIKEVFESTPGVVDVDWYVEDDQKKLVFEPDRAKAALNGVDVEAIAQSLRLAVGGMSAGLLHADNAKEPVELYLRMPLGQRADIRSLKAIAVPSRSGTAVPLSELVRVRETTQDKTIYHKNLKRVTYVTGDVAGAAESPIYAILDMKDRISGLKTPAGYSIEQYSSVQPRLDTRYAMKWDGELQITYEVFRDLGVAFAAVLVIIYILVVAWFRSFIIPVIIMAPIPLTLVGILPGHWAFHAFFTATSMIGFIALSGIIVRNSILLVDFIQMEWKDGKELKEAVVSAGAVRMRPILLTALAVVAGSFVMLFDPIFQGLAISMMFGAVASTALTLVAVPLLYYEVFKNRKPAPDGE